MAPKDSDVLPSCAQCGTSGAPASCGRCKAVSYCGPACQRAHWKAGHKSVCGVSKAIAATTAATAPPVAAAPAQAADGQWAIGQGLPGGPGPWPVRCPASLLTAEIPRLSSITSAEAQDLLCSGQAFVAPAKGILGTRLSRWNFKYLSEHLPAQEKYGVMLDEGSGKIVMSHSARNGQRQVELEKVGKDSGASGKGGNQEQPLSYSDQSRMTFAEFLEQVNRYRQTGKGKMPYFGIHLLWRFQETDNGFLGKVDEEMADDMWSVNFPLIKEWQEANLLPLVQRFYLFAGLGGTLYHCHYDLQPNLHVQLSGKKRFIIFSPDNWSSLYPFPLHHDLDRRSQVDFDKPDYEKFPEFKGARGTLVELNPGDALYIPPYWWHHVQSITPETTSMAMWFFERFPLSPSVSYGMDPGTEDLVLMRDVEEYVGKYFPDVPGEEDNSKPRPVKAKQVANYMQWLKPRMGISGGVVDDKLLSELTEPPEKVQESVFKLIEEADHSKEQARRKMQAFLNRRY
mmetsp:Transcript_99958/g.182327  ORF Transcript_99958/g.182327 Transcript_99958/m.182327 type:complete len:512 (-) Transcript_99958:272-1807(-)